MSDLIAIDTETGGLIAGESALLSLSIVPSWDYQPLTLYFEPIGQIDDGARKVNGYTPESWAAKGAMPLKHGLIAAQYWLEQSGAKKGRPGRSLTTQLSTTLLCLLPSA